MTDPTAGRLPPSVAGSLPLTRHNPPGQPALFYHRGAYQIILSRMLENLRRQKVTAQDETNSQPLIHFNTLAREDWTVAFLRAWAAVLDVLSFYQERMINEGYLRTAVERRSVLELTRAVGFELAPAVSATTYLAFDVHDAGPGKNIPIPRGTAVQSLPPVFSSFNAIQDIVQGQANPPVDLPVIFETTEDLSAQAAWNALKPSRIQGLHWPKNLSLNEDSRTLRLAGSTLGLKPGDLLLVTGRLESPAVPPAWELLQLSTVESQAKDGYTAVRWDWEYGRVPENGIANPAVYVFRQNLTLFPYAAGAVFRETKPGWAPVNIGLPPKVVQAAAASREGRLYAGIGQALYSSSDRGDSWQPLAGGLPRKDVQAVATDPSGTVAVGTDDSGVHLSYDGGGTWSPLSGPGEVEVPTGWRRFVESVRYKLPKTNIRSLLFTENKESMLLAGSDDGVFGYDAHHDSWVSMNEHMPDLDRKKGTAPLVVRVLGTADHGKRILAGTDQGVFLIEELLKRPSSAILTALLVFLISRASNSVIPTFLREFPNRMIIAIGILLILLIWQQPFRQKWVGYVLAIEIFTVLLFCTNFTKLQLAPDFSIYLTVVLLNLVFLGWNILQSARESLPGLVQKTPDWVKGILPGIFNKKKQPKVFSLLAVGAVVYAGTDHGVYQLDRQTWMVRLIRWWRRLLLGPEPEPWTQLPGWDEDSSDPVPADLAVTALASDGEGRLLAGTQAGSLYTRQPGPTQVWTAELHVPLESVRAIVTAKDDIFMMGEPLDAPQEVRWAPGQLEAGAVDVDALSLNIPADSLAAVRDEQSTALYLVTDAVEQASQDAKQAGRLTRFTLREKETLPYFNRARARFFCQSEPLALFDDQFLPDPIVGDQLILAGRVAGLERGKVMLISGKNLKGEDCSEPIIVQGGKAGSPDESTTTLQLKKSLVNVYDRDSVTIFGNIVPAIHGQTIRNESLGESDGTTPNQRFQLRSPLAYEPADADDYKSSLVVQVNKIPWIQVPSLMDQPAGARVYMVRRNDQGQTAIIFGDGEQGARLPTSREILTATYRSGGGEAGNVHPRSLTLLQSHLPHVKAVTNPGPAHGGLPQESAGHGREQAPRRVRALDRIVTLKDYGDFTSNFPGVSQSVARALPEGSPRRIEIVIVARTHIQPDPSQPDPLLEMLAQAIDGARSSRILPFKLRRVKPVSIVLKMMLYILPDMREDEERKNNLIRSVRQKILEKYSPEMQVLGQALTETEVFRLAQSVPGVTAVMLTGFQRRSPEQPENNNSAPGMLTATWDELLVIEDKDLELEVAE